MGFFTLEAARLVGPTGRVVAVDIQSKMLGVLRRRAERAGLLERLDTRLIKDNDLCIQDLKGLVDFVFAFAMVHEVPDPLKFFFETFAALRLGGKMLLVEPLGHVSEEHFANLIVQAQEAGLRPESLPKIRMSRCALLAK
jgi:ubiquinone/menaquinone biosynthesis C-methylase UbiE